MLSLKHVPQPVKNLLPHNSKSVTRASSGCPKDLHQRLCTVDKNVPLFNFDGQSFYARVIGIHDGDSVKVCLDVGGKLYKMMTRLEGIDTPEIRSKDPKEKALAIRARDYVAAWAMPDKFKVGGDYTEKELVTALWEDPVIVYLKCGELDKFGRLLCEMFKDDIEPNSLNELLLENGFADGYDGGRKDRTWDKIT